MPHSALSEVDHRPWPLAAGPWTWRQSWRDLLFAHWPVPASALRRFVPRQLSVQEHGGTSWVGVVPFRMTGIAPRFAPALPWISTFPELNVRLYVDFEDRPGVWFLSLDATNPLAVWAARRFFHLPYFRARMSLAPRGEGIDYRSSRAGAEFAGWYGPTSEVCRAAAGSLEHWLTERYCLYAAAPDGSLWRSEVHHRPWPLQRAAAQIEVNTMAAFHGIDLGGAAPLLHFARRLDVILWPAVRVV